MEFQNSLADRSNRFIAYLIDIIPIMLITFGIFYFFFGFDETLALYNSKVQNSESRIIFIRQRNWIRDISFIIWVVYCILMEASDRQGTLGKSAMGIKVVDENGERLSLNKSISRNITKILSYFVISLGFIWILFDKKKQGWHDKINKTFVVNSSFVQTK